MGVMATADFEALACLHSGELNIAMENHHF
jgi:hypothetical protein